MVTKMYTDMIELHTHTHTHVILKNTEKNEKHKGYYALKYIRWY